MAPARRQPAHRLLRRLSGPLRRLDLGRSRRGRRHHRRQRRRQEHAARSRSSACCGRRRDMIRLRRRAGRRSAARRSSSRRGIALVPEGRRLFPSLTVEENLVIGGQLGRPGRGTSRASSRCSRSSRERRNQRSTSLSGGQQQMVAIGRALMSNPRLLLCDELSLGLAPIVVQRDLSQRLPSIVAEGTAVVIVEQDVMQAHRASRKLYCLQEGRVSLEGRPRALKPREPSRPPISGSERCSIGSTSSDPGGAARRPLRPVRRRPVARSSASCGSSTSPMAT